MYPRYTTERLEALLGFPFRDRDWKTKFAIGSALALASAFVPLLPLLFLYGYFARVFRRVASGEDPSLPVWDDWNALLRDGAKLLVVDLVYLAPALLLGVVGYVLLLLPTFIAAGSETASPEAGFSFLSLFAASFGLMGLAIAAVLIISAFLPAALGHTIMRGSISAGFYVREWWAILRANIKGFLVAYLVLFAITTVTGFAVQILYLTIIFCCLSPLIVSPIQFYATVLAAALFGQAYGAGRERAALAVLTRESGATAVLPEG